MTQKKRWIGFLLAGLTVLTGFLLVQQQTQPVPETVERMEAVQELQEQTQPFAPAGTNSNPDGLVATERNNAPVVPSVVDFSQVVISTEDPNSMYERWLRGELDFDEVEGVFSEIELLQQQELARKLLFDPTIQNASAESLSPLAPTLGTGFESMDYTDGGGSVPPDPELAVGNNHVIAVANVAVAIYDKNGTAVVGPTLAGNLFPNTSTCQSGLYDPNVLYDEEADRWFLAYDQGPQSSTGGYCVLASQTDDPTGLWNEYFFQTNDSIGWMDYPHAGVGDNYIVMGGNVFRVSNNSFIESRVYAFNKADLYAGNATTMIEQTTASGTFTPQPLNLHGFDQGTWPSHGDNHYILMRSGTGLSTSALYEWNIATNVLSSVGTVSYSGSVGVPLDFPQSGGSDLQGNDQRPQDFEYRNGYGWTVMTVSCNPGSGSVNCIRWAQVDLTDASLGPQGTGVYGSDGDYRSFGDLAVNRCDDMAVGYTKSNTSMFPSVWVTGRESGDTAGTLQAETEIKAGEIAYTAFDGAPFRWGDYTGMTIAPDGETFWYLGEYSKDTGTTNGRWALYVASFTYANCANGLTPPSVVVDSSVEVGIAPDSTLMTTLSITNTGGTTLTWTIQEDDGAAPVLANTQIAEARPAGQPVVLGNGNIEFGFESKPVEAPLDLTAFAPEAAVELTIDDGTIESVLGFGGLTLLYSNRFTPNPSDFPFELETISVGFPSSAQGVNAGDALELYVYQDTDNDPTNGGISMVGSYNATVGAPNAVNNYTLSTPLQLDGPGDVWIGYYNTGVATSPGEFAILTDDTTYQTRSWVSLDINDPTADGTIDNYGSGTNFIIRGAGETVTVTPATCEAPDDISWLTVSPTSGSVVSNTTNAIDLTFDSTGLSTGVFTGTLCMETNDTANLNIQIPVTMTVCNAPVGTLDVSASHSGNDTILSWSTVGADYYEIHWSTDPYFTPDSSTLQATSATGGYTHVGSNGASYYYYVIPADNCGNSSVTGTNSNQTGSFEFAITPGT